MLDLYGQLQPWMGPATQFVLWCFALAAVRALLEALGGDD